MKEATKRILKHLVSTNRVDFDAAIEVAPAIDKIITQEGARSGALQLFPEPSSPTGPAMETKQETTSQAPQTKGKKPKTSRRLKPGTVKRVRPLGRANLILAAAAKKNRTISREHFLAKCKAKRISGGEILLEDFIYARRLVEVRPNVYEVADVRDLVVRRFNEGISDPKELGRLCKISASAARSHLDAATSSGQTKTG